MLSLKIFNELPYRKRKDIARLVFGHMSNDFVEEMAKPYHHNFDKDGGHWYKLMLDHCTYNKEKKIIKITFNLPV